MDRSTPEAAAAARQNPERMLGFEDWLASDSLWIDAVTETLDDLATAQAETPVELDSPCIGPQCQGATRGADIVALLAIGCIVAGITTWAAIRGRRSIRLTTVGYFRTAGYAARRFWFAASRLLSARAERSG